MPPSRIAHHARNEVHCLQALVVIFLHVLARHVIPRLQARLVFLRFRGFLPLHCLPLLLRSSSAADGTLVHRPTPPDAAIQVTPPLAASESLHSSAFVLLISFMTSSISSLFSNNSTSAEIRSSKTKTS